MAGRFGLQALDQHRMENGEGSAKVLYSVFDTIRKSLAHLQLLSKTWFMTSGDLR